MSRRAGIGLLLLCTLAVVASRAYAADPPITAAAFAPDGKAVVIGSQAGVEMLSWPQLQVLRRIETRLVHVHDIAFSPDGDRLVLAGGEPAESGSVEVFTWPEVSLVAAARLHDDLIHSARWSADGGRILTASADGTCAVYDTAAQQVVQRFSGHSRPVLDALFLPDGGTIVSAGIDQTLRVWRAGDGEQLRSLHNHTASVRCLALRPGGDGGALPMIASAGEDRTVRLWQPTIGRMVRFTRLESRPLALAWKADGASLVVCCEDGSMRVLDAQTLEVIATRRALDWPFTLALSPEGEALVGGAGAKLMRLTLP